MRKGSPYENEIKHRIGGSRFIKKEVKRIEISEPQGKVGCFNMKQTDNWGSNGNSESLDPCPFCHRYGHKENTCYAKSDLRYKEGLQLKAQRKYLGKGRKMQQVENDKEEMNAEAQEREEPGALRLAFENIQRYEVGSLTMAAIEEMRGYEQDLSMENVYIFLGSKVGENTYDVVVEKDGQQFIVCGCLDSGADTSATARDRFERYCILKDELGIGKNLEVSIEEYILRLKKIINEKLVDIMKKNIVSAKDLNCLREILMNNAQGFGDDKSPTQISKLKPIECNVKNEDEVGVYTSRPMGPEKEDILRNMIKQMLRAGIIKPNRNPTISMHSLIAPKVGPKKYRFVIDFRPLNNYTRKVDSTLPDINNQLSKVKGMRYFGQYHLLSGFNYLPTQEDSQRFFTFCTPNVLQWIDDTILLGATLKEFCLVTKKFLKQLTQKRLWLNITNCDFFLKDAVLCGHLLTEEGHRLDKKCVVDLLGRRKPKYVHELPQLIFIRNWIAGILPYFARLRFILTEKYSIVGKIKALERRKELIVWTEERNLAYRERVEKLEESFTATLGYFDAKLGVILFVDASKKHWVYFICQAEEEIDVKQILATQFKVIAMSSGTFKREGKLIVTPSLIPSILMHTNLRFNHGAAVLEKKVIEKEYTPLDHEVTSLLMEGWKRFRRQRDVLGRTGVLDLTEKQEKTLEESTKEVQKDILAYREKAFGFAQRAREYQNALYNKRFKLTPLCFSEGEFVLVSKAIKHEKLKPQWVGPYIVKKQLSEHLYEVATIMGKTMEVHSSRIIFFPPSEFLPNPGTKITFLNDSRKLEVKRFRGIKEEAGGFLLKVEWRGFSNERDWTWEPPNIMFEDLPKLVVKYLAEKNTREMNEAKRYLKVAYPNGWKWEDVNISRFQVRGVEATRVTYD
eukprot:augustus_masked-scaffold_15-processed-gene-4.14-mRNA-1 protein AED:1.00 eAED:1.00 QI:0/0/0/0/1/1/6/0/907